MSSYDRLSKAIETGILPASSVRAALGGLGASAAEQLQVADPAPLSHPDVHSPKESLDFMTTYLTARDLYFSRLGLNLPMWPDFETAGYSKKELVDAYNHMQAENLEPELVIAPQLTLSQIERLFNSLSDDTSVPNHRLFDAGVFIDPGMRNNQVWNRFCDQGSPFQPIATVSNTATPETNWTICIIPGTARSLYSNTPYDSFEPWQILPTIPQLVALHAQRIQTGKTMVDEEVWSWARCEVGEEHAPAVRWSPGEGVIDILRADRKVNTNVGARPIVWKMP